MVMKDDVLRVLGECVEVIDVFERFMVMVSVCVEVGVCDESG